MPYLYYNIVFVVYYYVNNMNGVPTPNRFFVKLLSILSKSRPSKPSPTGEVIVDLHQYSSSSIPSVTVACNHQNGRRKRLVAALVVGILPMLQILLWIVGGVLRCISNTTTTEESIKFTYFDAESTVHRTIVYASSLLVYTNYSSN
jgi:hypothetical protein